MTMLPADFPPYSREFLVRMGQASTRLKTLLDSSGLKRSDGIRLVSRLAKEHGLRDWPDTRNEADYDSLIEAVQVHIANTRPRN